MSAVMTAEVSDLKPVSASVDQPARSIKVLFFYQDFGAMGGIERYLLQKARLLRERGNVEPVFVCCDKTPLYNALQAEGFHTYGLPSHSFFARSLFRTFDVCSLLRLKDILRREQPDLVHVHIGLLENMVIRALGFPVIYTFHGYSTLYSMDGVRN